MVIYHKNLFQMDIDGCKITSTLIMESLFKRKNGKRIEDSILMIKNNWIEIL